MRAKRVWKKEVKSSKIDLTKSLIAVVRAIVVDLLSCLKQLYGEVRCQAEFCGVVRMLVVCRWECQDGICVIYA